MSDLQLHLKSEALRSRLFAMPRIGATVARELGLSPQRISQWERGFTIPARYHQAIEAILARKGGKEPGRRSAKGRQPSRAEAAEQLLLSAIAGLARIGGR